jgi:hypothetical protein
MAIDERARHRLYLRLEEVLGSEEATVLMEHLPPVGWADVATKHDLAELERRIELRFEAVEHRIESSGRGLEARLTDAWRAALAEQAHRSTMFALALNSALAAIVGTLAFAAARLV